MATNPKPLRRLEKKHFGRSRAARAQYKNFKALRKNPYYPLHHYILYKRNVLPVTFWQWAVWFEYSKGRIIKQTTLPDGVRVSTVFIGLEYQRFETMIFGGPHKGYQVRRDTYEAALRAHQTAIELMFEV